MEQLFTVTDCFHITGRGLVLIPGLEPNDSRVKPGQHVLLRLPDGTTITTRIIGLEHVLRRPEVLLTRPIMLPLDVGQDNVPIGTEVYLVDGPVKGA
jgi:hypothetical protein